MSGAAVAQDLCGPRSPPGPRYRARRSSRRRALRPTPSGACRPICEVQAEIRPVAGSKIGAVYRLPASWNGKVLGLGGGGFAGNVRAEAAAEGLARGYAVMQNDMGHPSPSALDPSFAIDARRPAQRRRHRRLRPSRDALATVIGKEVAAKHYGRAPERAYWQGCSTGGRQGLAEVQRYPDDYDGVIAGAPVYTPLTYANAMLRVQMFHARPESNLKPEHVPLIQRRVLAACDATDGVADGILTDPRTCAWDPAELQCDASSGAAIRAVSPPHRSRPCAASYGGVRMQRRPLRRDAADARRRKRLGRADDRHAEPAARRERAARRAVHGVHRAVGDPKYDFMTFDPERDWRVLDGGIAAAEVHQQNPNIAPFVASGGKLLLWHGFNDPGPSPLSTIAYYDAVLEASAGRAETACGCSSRPACCTAAAGRARIDSTR